MQPAVQATTRTPGPSTVAPVVNECRKPMSPVASAERTSVSGTSLPRLTRNSNGLFASSVVEVELMSGMVVSCSYLAVKVAATHEDHSGLDKGGSSSMESPVD